MAAKVFVFGVDSMEPQLIQRWIESGDLPNLARFRQRAAWASVRNPPRFFSGATWPTFYTGVRPARHGFYLRTDYDRTTCVHRPFRPGASAVAPFWSTGAWRGLNKAVLNVPYCPVDPSIHGLQLSDWGLHDRHEKQSRASSPQLAAEIAQHFGEDPVGDCEGFASSVEALADLRQRLLQRVRLKLEMTQRYLNAADWDLYFSVFDEPHCAGHRFWHLHDPGDAHYDAAMAATLGDTLKEIYVAIDRAFGAAINGLPDQAAVLFVSSHGMGPAHDGTAVLDEILRRFEGGAARSPLFEEQRGAQLGVLRRVVDRLPQPMRRGLEPLRRRFGRAQLRQQLDQERAGRKYFWFPTHDLCGGIRLNLAGRELHGVVQPPAIDAVVAELTAELLQLRDGRSGEPLVREVVRSADMDLHGWQGEFPDLLVHWGKAAVSWVESPKIGRIDPYFVRRRSGDHDPSMLGVFFARAPHCIAGRLEESVRIEDFASTISALLGVTLPDVDGDAIRALLP